MAALMVALAIGGCELATPCDDLEVPVGQSAEGLVVTPSEHADGWGREDCAACHTLSVIHMRECTDGVDYLELDEILAADGYDSCHGCHGDNGAAP